jgi:hypothetical protein
MALALKQEPRAGVIAPAKRSTGLLRVTLSGVRFFAIERRLSGRSIGYSGSIAVVR